MNTDYFKYFWEVHKTKSINKAAENLFLSQPYLSKCIKEVERQVGAQLIKRSPRGVEFTETGEKFICHVQTILTTLSEIESLAQQPKVIKTKLMISCFNSFTLINLIHQYSQERSASGLQVNYLELQNHQIIEHVQNAASDIGVFYHTSSDERDLNNQLKSAGLTFIPILSDELYAIVGKQHPLYSATEVNPSQLLPYPFLLQKIKSDLAAPDKLNRDIYQLFKSFQIDLVALDHSASLLFQISKDSHHFTVGQKAFNVDNPLVQHGEIKYLRIIQTNFKMLTGLIVKEARAEEPIVLDFLNALKAAVAASF